MTFGVGVEGPSDKHFWDKVLHKHFKGHSFDVCNMKNRDKLIRETPRLLNQFQNMRYAAGFILVDTCIWNMASTTSSSWHPT